jgi:CRISPR/Cas system endoribonuclease Cas6 (RAMP superfamily)
MKIDKKVKLLEQLKTITDFRKDKHKIEYPLHEIIFRSLFGLLKGNLTFVDLHY